MGTRSEDQQKKQRQKEFKEKKENLARLKSEQKANRERAKRDDTSGGPAKTKV